MTRPDVTIRGAGIFGLSVAWACVGRGARVRVIDPGGPGDGSSGGVVGALAPHVPENWNSKKAFQLQSLLAAEEFWRGVAEVSGIDPGYRRRGRLQPLDDKVQELRARARGDGAVELWGAAAKWEVVSSTGAGWEPPSATGLLVRDTLSAHLHPRQACESLAAALAARGCDLLQDGEEDGAVVHATGWQGLRDLSVALGRNVGLGVKGQAVLLRHAAPEGAPQIFADGLHLIPHGDGTVAVGSTTERDWDDPAATDDKIDDLRERAAAVLPILHGAAVVARWAGVRPRAKTRAPMLGHWPGRAGHFVANGGFKIGFGMAPGVAEVMADLVLEGRDRVPEGFRVEDNL